MFSNRENVRSSVLIAADDVRSQIKAELKGKLVSIKVDLASRFGRSFMGINVQFLKDAELTLRTLAAKELEGRHTSEELLKYIKSILADYEIDIENLYTFTSDNATNMIKLCRLVRECHEKAALAETEDCSDEDNDENYSNIPDDEEDNGDEDDEGDEEDSEPLTLRIEGEEEDEHQAQESEQGEMQKDEEEVEYLVEACEEHHTDLGINCIRCAAHSLQLAINDSLNAHCTSTISRARKAVVEFRVPSMLHRVQEKAREQGILELIIKAILDNDTRWLSVLEMLLSLRPYRRFNFLLKKSVKLTEMDWKSIESCIKSLMPAKIATKRLQEENLLLTDFVVVWKQCIFEIQEINTPLARSLVKNLETRLQLLMESEVVLAAMLLDLRVCTLLTKEQEEQAIQHLRELWNKLQASAKRVAVGSSEPVHEGQEFRKNSEVARRRSVAIALRSFSHQTPRPLESSVLACWKEDRYKWPELFSLAMIVLATPATQVSVERLFSAMKFIFSVYRSNLKGNILDAILVIRCNKDIFCKNEEIHKNKKLKSALNHVKETHSESFGPGNDGERM